MRIRHQLRVICLFLFCWLFVWLCVGSDAVRTVRAESEIPVNRETAPEPIDSASDSGEETEETQEQETSVKLPERLPLLRDFPFRSIVGFEFHGYSDLSMAEIYNTHALSVGSLMISRRQQGINLDFRQIATGVFISADGLFLTTHDQIRDLFDAPNHLNPEIELKVLIRQVDKLLNLRLVRRDIEGDLVLFQVARDPALADLELPFVSWQEAYQPSIGQPIFGIGFPELTSIDGGLLPGFVTEINMPSLLESGTLMQPIMTNAFITKTMSGALIVNAQGQAIGISTSRFTRQISDRLSSFYPANQIAQRLRYLLSDQVAQPRTWAGIQLLDSFHYEKIQSIYRWPQGLYVSAVMQESPAYVSDLRSGDIITRVGGENVTEPARYRDIINAANPGEPIILEIYRPHVDRVYEKTLYLDHNPRELLE